VGLFPLIGGDARIASRIAAMIHRGNMFVEGFGGAGSLTLHLAEKSPFREMVWNDLDPLYYNSFRPIKHHPESLQLIQQILVRLSKCLQPDERRGAKQLLKEVRSGLLDGSIGWPWDAVWAIGSRAPRRASGWVTRRTQRSRGLGLPANTCYS